MSDDDEKKPRLHLRLVVENDKKTIDEEQARIHLIGPLKNLTANILRIVRGAGKPYRLRQECIELLNVFDEFRERVGHWPRSDQIAEILDIENANRNGCTNARDRALKRITCGSLQFAASRMLHQRPQEVAGEYEMSDGIRDLESYRERARSEYLGWNARKKRRAEPEEEIDLGPAPKKAMDKTSTSRKHRAVADKPAPRGKPQPGLPSKKPDRKTPPNYDRCARYQMTEEERAEFRVNNIDDLVAIANAYLIAAGRWPLTQADFPSTKSSFEKVAKLVRAFQEQGK